MAKQLIDEATIEAARERVLKGGFLPAARIVCKEEPDLHYAISRIAVEALSGLEGMPLEAQDAAHRAVWEGALLAVESYRLAHYRLWRGTALGTLLEQLDPRLANGPAGGNEGLGTDEVRP
ncbi:MAG TPA: hypothetical protein VGR35_11770 [Tepidisphaeraceae bacterium]|nr:hypothetical protein [Tepidisphaeraceae bacterium]